MITYISFDRLGITMHEHNERNMIETMGAFLVWSVRLIDCPLAEEGVVPYGSLGEPSRLVQARVPYDGSKCHTT